MLYLCEGRILGNRVLLRILVSLLFVLISLLLLTQLMLLFIVHDLRRSLIFILVTFDDGFLLVIPGSFKA
jgi:hypothetical protein